MKLFFQTFIAFVMFISCGSSNNKTSQQSPLLSQRTDIQLEIDQSLGTPILMKGNLSSLDVLSRKNVFESALLFVEQNKDIFNLKEPRKELALVDTTTDELGFQHVTFQRQVDEVTIWGDELKIHFNKDGVLYFVNGRYHPSLPENFVTRPALNQADCEEIAVADAIKNINASTVKETELVIFPQKGTYHLVYRINIVGGVLMTTNWEYFVDAANGEIVHKYNNIQNPK